MPELSSQNRPRRVAIHLEVVLELSPAKLARAIVDDISKDGFRLRTRAVLRPGQRVFLHMRRDRVACEVRWVSRPEAGGVFIDAAAPPSW